MLEILKSLLLSFFAIAILLPVVRFALRTLSPVRDKSLLTADEAKYIQKKEWKLTLLYYFFACVLAIFSAGMLSLVASGMHTSGDNLFLLTPNFKAMFAPGLLIGLTLAVLPLWLVQRVVLHEDYELYKSYLLQQEGYRSKRTYTYLFALMLSIACAFGWYAMRWHVAINKQEMRITNLTMNQKEYPLRGISSIRYLGKEGEYLITFRDGFILNTSYLKPVTFETIALISQQSGKKVIR